jgi:hypothetical protein
MGDCDRFRPALSGITGKRLTYERLTGKDRGPADQDQEAAPNAL